MADQLSLPVNAKDDTGFSLIELLVVLSILAVLAVGATLSAGRSGSNDLADIAAFEKRFAALRAHAIHGQTVKGLFVSPRGFQGAEQQNGRWLPAGREQRWQHRVRYDATGARVGQNLPTILFLPNGATTAFRVTFQSAGQDINCSTDGWAALQCAPS
ncbi:prepilin-type N-terminal cleavage/methylation domain-containing protein [uncultured Litoreibacter sp.]|uniref:prepilin-type N-terminal cleavage/methylation domain-containing protein n=1 Tax=uncultured Litoreibacter sp. TaxID=1392394 RepID=UPI002629F4A0|nr:prepilin-type N-terminal cleavage/methylation domain-containing protein [uncultured Litoreibacter sp.]